VESNAGGFLALVERRQSVRRYLDKPVEREQIALCLEAARLSPSTSNSQPWRFVVVDEPELKDLLASRTAGPLGTFNTFASQAPVLVAVVTEAPNLEARVGALVKRREFSLIDIGIAAVQFCLQAAELGLGTCIMGWFDERGVKRALGIPRGRRVHLMISLGYPADGGPRPKKRKSLTQIHAYNRYQGAKGGKAP